MFAKTIAAAVRGIEGESVTVEVDIARGLPAFDVVGLGDTAVKEACRRVKSAIVNSDGEFPSRKVIVNLAPAYLPKKGSHFDLSIAIGILAASAFRIEKAAMATRCGFLGELQLDGSLSAVKGVLPMVRALAEPDRAGTRLKAVFIPDANMEEGRMAQEAYGVQVIGASTLTEVLAILDRLTDGQEEAPKVKARCVTALPEKQSDTEKKQISVPDFADVKGQWAVKEAIATAVCGKHGLLMIGSPGAGKTMLARRIPSILPEMTAREKLETTMIYSVAGLLQRGKPMIDGRPFRTADYRATSATLIGGGNAPPYPGEASLAHNGVLFIDEFLELGREQIECLRRPLEEKEIHLMRGGQVYTYPADFMLVGATNPCRCGYYGDERHVCTCTQTQLDQYRSRLSGPIADRIDMFIEVRPVSFTLLQGEDTGSSQMLREKVERGREKQRERFRGMRISYNSQMESEQLREFCPLGKDEQAFLASLYNRYSLSTRRHDKLLRLARTVADVEDSPEIQICHLATAFRYIRFLVQGETRGGEGR